ncbi:MAG: SRPBCC family protein [Myxococcales bacterium]|nr:SRPBCC family protein [Myxococcales bacterium]MBK7192003.1 SRPBCC family protein [Myxococcales bacterium]MBP6842160.1 SRPBCC family protein [Kofleriaceae bacterium]
MGNTLEFHRVVKAPPARVYRAFLDGPALAKWLPPDGFTATVHALDPQVGGRFRMSFTNFATQHQHSFGGEYLELREGELLRYSDRFDDPNLPGELIVTVRLRAVSCGTDLHVTQANIPEVIPPELCVLGWQDSLRQLAALVETAAP